MRTLVDAVSGDGGTRGEDLRVSRVFSTVFYIGQVKNVESV